jgi:uncharacterized protein affecting Mg2+/Co2+ transport
LHPLRRLQINNAREEHVSIVAHTWVTIDARGERTVQSGEGVGGSMDAEHLHLPAGEAMRHRGVVSCNRPTCNAFGSFRVSSQGGDEWDAEIGSLGLAEEGGMVEDFRVE